MTDDRSLERAARAWLEDGPTQAPDRSVEAALLRIQTTTQDRDLRIPWRPTTMMDRLAVAAMAAVLAIGTLAFGASLISKPTEPAAGVCPREFSEAEAIDTFAPGLSQAQRAWGVAGGAPQPLTRGGIAAFAYDAPTDSSSVTTIDPTTGAHCRLLTFLANPPVQAPAVTSLDWSPSGDALALGLGGDEGPDGLEDGQVLIWTPGRLLRVWSGSGTPYLEWAPDGRSIAVWSCRCQWSSAPETRIIHADGSPDRTFELHPWFNGLTWSPDGSRWLLAQAIDGQVQFPLIELAVVSVADGRSTPFDPGIPESRLEPVRWIDEGRVLLAESQPGVGIVRYLDVPLATPEGFSLVPMPHDATGTGGLEWPLAFSPGGRRAAFVGDDGGLAIFDTIAGGASRPIRIPADDAVAAAWSPDGTQVVVQADEQIWLVHADGGTTRQIASGDYYTLDDPWQPIDPAGR
jgi:WD40 repeat protein